MEQWQDQAIILSARAHGENGAIVSILTESNGRQAGYVHGATSSKKRGDLQIGNLVDARWQARVHDQLGTLSIELIHNPAAHFLSDPLRLSALLSACALCDQALPEREGHAGLYHGFRALLDALEGEFWAQVYVMWEIALLRELGFSLDLTKCAGGGDAANLAYVSPKTGRAVSAEAAGIYKERLLKLPGFLIPHPSSLRSDSLSLKGEGSEERSSEQGEGKETQDILTGLKLTGYFLEHWAFAHHTKGMPEARVVLEERMGKHEINNCHSREGGSP